MYLICWNIWFVCNMWSLMANANSCRWNALKQLLANKFLRLYWRSCLANSFISIQKTYLIFKQIHFWSSSLLVTNILWVCTKAKHKCYKVNIQSLFLMKSGDYLSNHLKLQYAILFVKRSQLQACCVPPTLYPGHR